MDTARPSRTALRVALRRAAHQIYDSPLVFTDPVAVPILGPTYTEELHRTPTRPDRPFSTALRAFLVARSRYAEDNLAHAVSPARGDRSVSQYVLLGAGLDTFAHRNPFPHLRVFEADHPATQQWKRDLLQANGLLHPPSLAYVPVNFEHQRLSSQLLGSGFDVTAPTLFAWLGVVPYLTLAAFRSTVNFISTLPHGSGVVLDYGQPRSVLPSTEQLAHDSLASRVQLSGEPFQLFFTPAEIASELHAFRATEDLGSTEINALYFADRTDNLRLRGSAGRLLSAWL